MAGELGPTLYAEGLNDLRSISSLLNRKSINHRVNDRGQTGPSIQNKDGVDKLLRSIPSAIANANFSLGFVIDSDADVGVQSRWRSIRDRLAKVPMMVDANLPREGFIGTGLRPEIKVGFWLMPDNRRDGTLEHFLFDLIEEKDDLLELAKSSTAQASLISPRFPEVHRPKAEIHTWLAWQEKPGQPYGQAITSNYFKGESETSDRFIAWFRNLFEISD